MLEEIKKASYDVEWLIGEGMKNGLGNMSLMQRIWWK
jgi:hypothetical protein